MIKYDTPITSYCTVWQKRTDLYTCAEWVLHVMTNVLTGTTESSEFERILLVLSKVHTNERWTVINFAVIWVQYYTALHFFHTISVINSITRSSNRSTLSVYGFWSSPNPNIIHLSSLEKSRLRPERVAPRGASASSSSNC